MYRFLKGLVLLPLAILIVLLAVANRQSVQLSLDPFSPTPLFSFSLPLYALIFAAVSVGIVVGGIAAWLGQGPVRVRARNERRERERLERKVALDKLNANDGAFTVTAGRTALPAPR